MNQSNECWISETLESKWLSHRIRELVRVSQAHASHITWEPGYCHLAPSQEEVDFHMQLEAELELPWHSLAKAQPVMALKGQHCGLPSTGQCNSAMSSPCSFPEPLEYRSYHTWCWGAQACKLESKQKSCGCSETVSGHLAPCYLEWPTAGSYSVASQLVAQALEPWTFPGACQYARTRRWAISAASGCLDSDAKKRDENSSVGQTQIKLWNCKDCLCDILMSASSLH